ncbi:DUF6044 family protein [Sulfurimonas sp. HSL-1656]|uniref:DUF6044 family protein n=1 Tax=Thiomicrolovo subterrani TaxID=3131934 RepID=UPI0031F783D7
MSITSLSKFIMSQRLLWQYLGIALLMFYLSPLVLYGEHLLYLVFDNLDSNVVWFKVLAESGMLFAGSDAIVPNMMGGLPRGSYGSEYNVLQWLYYFFKPINAYVINEILMHVVAYFSMYLFLDRIVFRSEYSGRYPFIVFGALYYAVLPFWPSGGLSVPLMPLVVYALLKIRAAEGEWWHWILLALLPLYSSFILVYMFFIIAAALLLVIDTVRTRSLNRAFFFALFMMGSLFLLVEYRLVYMTFFDTGFVSHRTEFEMLIKESLLSSYRASHLEFLNGNPHAKGLHLTYIVPTMLLAMLLAFSRRKFSMWESLFIWAVFGVTFAVDIWSVVMTQKYTMPLLLCFAMVAWYFQKKARLLPLLLLVQILLSYWFGYWFYEGLDSLKTFVPSLEMLNMSRFFFFQPMIWALIAAVALKIIYRRLELTGLFVILLFALQLHVAKTHAYFGIAEQEHHMTYENYYAEEMFDEIRKFIGKDQKEYRVVSLGIEPAPALFNGFYTLDGYSVNYPLEYKKEFRKIIEKHLDQHAANRQMYDEWGSKVYMFAWGCNYIIYDHTVKLDNLDFNTTQMYNMGARYILSGHEIITPEKLGLSFMRKFTGEHSYWDIYLYEIIPGSDKNQKKNN